MTAALEWSVQPQSEDVIRKPEGHDASTHREDVGVVVLARQAGGVEVVAQRRANTAHLVGGNLLALSAAAENDSTIRFPRNHRAPDGGANRRVVNRRITVRAVVVDVVPKCRKGFLQMFFERKAGMVCANRNPHGQR